MDGIGWAASAMSAARTRLDVAAENLANGSTDGFRRSIARGFLTPAGISMRAETSGEQGALRRTGRELDLAITGSGAFRVRDARGGVALTRDGAFSRDQFGRLVDASGRVLLGARGPVRLREGGRIQDLIAHIPLPPGSSVRSGFLETSNVDAIGEMIDVMSAQRSFETAQKVLAAIDGTRERAATQVALVKS